MSITAGSTARADDFINKAQANGTPANDAGRVPKLESDGKLDRFFIKDTSCHVYQTGATTIGATFTVMNFGAELFDTDTMHDNSTNPNRITFTTAGKYLVGGTVVNTGSNAYVGLQIRLNGSTILASTNSTRAGGTDDAGASASVLYNFAASDYIEFLVGRGQDGGGSTSGDAQTNAWAIKIQA